MISRMELSLKEFQNIETEMLQEVSRICEKHEIQYFLAYGSVLGAIRHQGPIPWDLDIDIIVPYHQLSDFISIVRKELSTKFFLDFHDINKYYTATFPRIGLKGFSTVNLHIDVFIASGLPNSLLQQRSILKNANRLRKIHFYKLANEKYRGKLSLKTKIIYFVYKIFYSYIRINRLRRKFYELCAKYPYDQSDFIFNPGGSYGLKEVIPKSFLGNSSLKEYSSLQVRVPEYYTHYLKHFYNDFMELPSENQRKVSNKYSLISFSI